MITVYHYPRCGTCKKALRWLDEHGVDYQLVDIVDNPPSSATLKRVHEETRLPVSKLFNTSGQLYREGGYKDRLREMSDADALKELAAHGKLIKRPLVVGDGVHLVGFKEPEYEAALS